MRRPRAPAQTPNYLGSLEPDPVLRPVRSEQDLADMNSLGMFTRRSSFADVPYLALPGINSRVSYTASQHSVQSELNENFIALSDVTLMPSFTPALLKATFAALLSAFQFGCAAPRAPRVRALLRAGSPSRPRAGLPARARACAPMRPPAVGARRMPRAAPHRAPPPMRARAAGGPARAGTTTAT